MTALSIEPRGWTWRRWWSLIALTFLAQLGLIYALSNKTPPRARQPFPAPKLALLGNSQRELVSLSDPTLFALPHQVGFSGPAWMKVSFIPPHTNNWTEEPRPLPLPADQLGRFVAGSSDSSRNELLATFSSFEPEPKGSEPLFAGLLRQKSEFRLGAGLEQRRLKTVLNLPSWPNSDFLTNTVVKLFINGDGVPISMPVLLSSSGLKAADDYALAQASAARFRPIPNEGPARSSNPFANATWGTMIFEWQTLPMSASNAGSANPQ